MLSTARQHIIHALWQTYCVNTTQMQTIISALNSLNITATPLDHFAVIDLPSAHSGITTLSEIFSLLGYLKQGTGYLADKQNDFLWLAEEDTMNSDALLALPQVVVADFRLNEMPTHIQSIIKKYTAHIAPAPLAQIKQFVKEIKSGHRDAIPLLQKTITDYLAGIEWPLPTIDEFKQVQAFNELLAWVFVFGRRPNHFTIAVHHIAEFSSINDFCSFIENTLLLPINTHGGKIKGTAALGIAQGSTTGFTQVVKLQDGEVALPTGFVEFVWRYPINRAGLPPTRWNDYFTGFIPQNANQVIESLYLHEKTDTLSTIQG